MQSRKLESAERGPGDVGRVRGRACAGGWSGPLAAARLADRWPRVAPGKLVYNKEVNTEPRNREFPRVSFQRVARGPRMGFSEPSRENLHEQPVLRGLVLGRSDAKRNLKQRAEILS